ncbi:retrovirus-related pol polyprotein from transposon TNT 1-94, partial [Tanacetum coccineum]
IIRIDQYPKYTPPGYNWKPKSQIGNVNPNISMPLGHASRTANILEHKTPRCSTVSNTPLSSNSFAARTVKFGNDQIAPILGYGDLVQGTITIKRVYYVEGLNHNLFSVGQFCDADLEVAFRKSTCYIHDLKGNDLLTGSRGTDLYSITLQDSTTPNPIWLMAKATKPVLVLKHVMFRRLSHLNFDAINLLSKNNIITGLPKLKFVKDHICSSCELGKAKRKGLHAQVRTVQTDKGTKFLNKTLHAYFAKEGIRHETSTAQTPEQNGVVKRRNHTLVEAARTMLSAAKIPLFFWAEAIATSCFTQNSSLRTPLQRNTLPYIHQWSKLSVKFFHIFARLVLHPEAEYASLSACCAQILWLRTQLIDYGFHFDKIPMYCDSKAAIAISCNPVQHSRTKHIDVRYCFIKEHVEKGVVELFFVGTEYQLADRFTKALSEDRFKYLVRRLGMRCLTPKELEVLANKSA